MLPRDRVVAVIEHRRPDRIPIYAWVRANLEEPLAERFGSVEAFEDHYAFDFAHLFGGPSTIPPGVRKKALAETGGRLTPQQVLDLPMTDVDNRNLYRAIEDGVAHHKTRRGRFVYVQTPGAFEQWNSLFGIENHLLYLALDPANLAELYARAAAWTTRYAHNCLDLGVDMIHLSDDWGSQRGLLFSPDTWRRLVAPYHRAVIEAVHGRGGYVSLHSDGDISVVVDDVLALGFDVVHPWQESAGMSLDFFHDALRDRLTVMGGLCVQTTLGFGRLDALERQIRRLVGLFQDGGLLLCTTHYVQEHCGIEELTYAFDLICELTRGHKPRRAL